MLMARVRFAKPKVLTDEGMVLANLDSIKKGDVVYFDFGNRLKRQDAVVVEAVQNIEQLIKHLKDKQNAKLIEFTNDSKLSDFSKKYALGLFGTYKLPSIDSIVDFKSKLKPISISVWKREQLKVSTNIKDYFNEEVPVLTPFIFNEILKTEKDRGVYHLINAQGRSVIVKPYESNYTLESALAGAEKNFFKLLANQNILLKDSTAKNVTALKKLINKSGLPILESKAEQLFLYDDILFDYYLEYIQIKYDELDKRFPKNSPSKIAIAAYSSLESGNIFDFLNNSIQKRKGIDKEEFYQACKADGIITKRNEHFLESKFFDMLYLPIHGVLDVFHDSERINFSFPFLKYETLDNYIKKNSMTLEDALLTTISLSSKIGAFQNKKKLIHRDHKPSNAMRLGYGKAMPFDFDLHFYAIGNYAKEQNNSFNGTLFYAPPELLAPIISDKNFEKRLVQQGYSGDFEIDKKVETFELGVMFHEFLFGFRPFSTKETDPYEVFNDIFTQQMKNFSKKIPFSANPKLVYENMDAFVNHMISINGYKKNKDTWRLRTAWKEIYKYIDESKNLEDSIADSFSYSYDKFNIPGNNHPNFKLEEKTFELSYEEREKLLSYAYVYSLLKDKGIFTCESIANASNLYLGLDALLGDTFLDYENLEYNSLDSQLFSDIEDVDNRSFILESFCHGTVDPETFASRINNYYINSFYDAKKVFEIYAGAEEILNGCLHPDIKKRWSMNQVTKSIRSLLNDTNVALVRTKKQSVYKKILDMVPYGIESMAINKSGDILMLDGSI